MLIHWTDIDMAVRIFSTSVAALTSLAGVWMLVSAAGKMREFKVHVNGKLDHAVDRLDALIDRLVESARVVGYEQGREAERQRQEAKNSAQPK